MGCGGTVESDFFFVTEVGIGIYDFSK